MKQLKTTYKDSGVDIDAGNKLVDRIKPLVKSTARTGSNPDLGGFGGLFDLAKLKYKDPILVSATDGVGTKLEIANTLNKHDTIGIDLVAMCVNDLIVQGAEPLFFLDYFATGKLDVDKAENIISGIVNGCKESGCALIGGETAEMPGMYQGEDYDLAGFAVGIVERDQILPRDDIKEGDIVIGIASSGVHSNGFSLIRHIIKEHGLTYDDTPDFLVKPLGETLLEPTRLYVKPCLELFKNSSVKALAHITGGGLSENIPRILPDNLAVDIDCRKWHLPHIFQWVASTGHVDTFEMLRTFNCGIGMVVIIAQEDLEKVKHSLSENNQTFFELGKVTARKDEAVIYENMDEFGE